MAVLANNVVVIHFEIFRQHINIDGKLLEIDYEYIVEETRHDCSNMEDCGHTVNLFKVKLI